MNEWMILIKYNLLIRVAFVTCRQKKRCWWGRYGSAGNVVLYIKLCCLKAPSVRYRWNITIKSQLKWAFYIMRVKNDRECNPNKGTKKLQQLTSKMHTHNTAVRIVRNVPDCHKMLQNISFFFLILGEMCSPENSGKHVHAHVIWKQTLTFWRVCVKILYLQ